ncbi:ABC transporter permease [Haloglycomyces albus]|uniref:ABC transporter permease n=1 Tax=Haloglycomyces albus TaxID=526067 RepID=UPI00046D5DDB|nr:ABC transporter permease [Haloglycomyces albus]
MIPSLRLAGRIAYREAWRNKGRTVLTIALLMFPLAVVSFAVTSYSTFRMDLTDKVQYETASADGMIKDSGFTSVSQPDSSRPNVGWNETGPEHERTTSERRRQLQELVPDVNRLTPYSEWNGGNATTVHFQGSYQSAQATPYDPTDPLLDSVFRFQGGQPTESNDEIVVSSALADHLDLQIGDIVQFAVEGVRNDFTVTGIAERSSDLNAYFLLNPTLFDDVIEHPYRSWLIDTDGVELDSATVQALNDAGFGYFTTSYPAEDDSTPFFNRRNPNDAIMLGLTITFVLIEIVLLVGPVFTIGVKRRTREFAMMSANGATPRQLRLTVLASGLFLGSIAAFVGIAVGNSIALVSLPALEQLVGHRVNTLSFVVPLQLAAMITAVLTAVAASLTAAVSASRVNVIKTISGHTAPPRARKRWLVIGLIGIALGFGCSIVGLWLNVTSVSIAGVIIVQIGLIGCTPSLVAVFQVLAKRLPVTPRIALRETARSRSIASPAVAAIMAVVGTGLILSSIAVISGERDANSLWGNHSDDDHLVLNYHFLSEEEFHDADYESLRHDVHRSLREVIDGAEFYPYYDRLNCSSSTENIRCPISLDVPAENRCPWDDQLHSEILSEADQRRAVDDPRCVRTTRAIYRDSTPIVGQDRELIAARLDLSGADLDRAERALNSGAAVVSHEQPVTDGTISVSVDNSESPLNSEKSYEIPAVVIDGATIPTTSFMVGFDRLAEWNLPLSSPPQEILIADADITPETGHLVQGVVEENGFNTEEMSISSYVWESNSNRPEFKYITLGSIGLSALIALAATVLATGMVIVESQRNLTTLGAVGSSPLMRRNLSMWQAASISTIGIGFGLIVGLMGLGVVLGILNAQAAQQYPLQEPFPFRFPWKFVLTVGLSVPLLAMASAWTFTRSHIPSERRIS